MKTKTLSSLLIALMTMAVGTSTVWAKKKKAPPITLTETGENLEAEYAKQLEALKSDISKSLPKVSDQKKAAYLKAREAEEAANAQLKEAQKLKGDLKKAQGLVAHAKGKWIGGAEKGIAKSKEQLKNAKTDAERQAAQKALAEWQKNKEEGLAALKERQALLDKALANEDKAQKEVQKAEAALAKAKADAIKAIKNLGLNSTLNSNKLDAKLAKYAIMNDATPRGLAAFAQESAAHKDLIAQMLSDDALLVQMAIADGASNAKYGRAMEIYEAIQKASKNANSGILQRLALAVSLQHASPIKQRNAVAKTDAPEVVNPVHRYLSYEKAFLNKELDPGFNNLSAWDLRWVVNGEEPDEISAWGREMMRNYRPDQVTKNDYRWRYVELVRSDIRYGSQENKYDKDELQFFQNILMNGGICGRRAFIGRFVLRAFGIPTIARPQPGHAALAHWTPDGWVVCLGGGWGAGTTKTQYKKDLDFLATTQARAAGDTYMQVKRAHWIGSVMGEKPVYGFLSGEPDFWNGLALYTQRQIIADSKAKTLAAVGEDIGEANVTKEKIEITKVKMTEEDRKIHVEGDLIKIPAAATTQPTKSTGKIIFMDSVLGGKQLHYSRNGGDQDFTYTFDAPKAGKYAMTMHVVTPSWKQNVKVSTNGGEATEFTLPHTVGMWEDTKPVVIELSKGENELTFSRKGVNQEVEIKGFSVKDITLKPVR